jgi:hypothetical protein
MRPTIAPTMTRAVNFRTLICSLLLVGFAGAAVFAGGPLFLLDGRPILWANRDVRGGPLNSQTVGVDRFGRRTVFYRVDSGPLNVLTNEQGVRLVDRIFGEYTDIPGASIKFANAGPILDPATGTPVDIDATNIGDVLDDTNPTFQNPIIFDSDGAITGSPGVLGFFSALQFEPDFSAVTESFVVLNGQALGPPISLTTASFLGVFTHEFGHFAGPLDHAQINGNIALGAATAVIPPGFTVGAAYDLFAPFIETVFPFLFFPRVGATQPLDTGYFIATLDLDTKNALAALYPTLLHRLTSGSIEGDVLFRSGKDKVVVNGLNVVARRINRGAYPPPLGTVAYPVPPTFDADGIPNAPPPRPVTDSLTTVSSAVTGLNFGRGTYRIEGLPPGFYLVQLQQINPSAVGGSGIGELNFQLTLPVREEYYNGKTTSNVVTDFKPVLVLPALVSKHVDLEVNGLDSSAPAVLDEAASHSTVPTAQPLPALPVQVRARAAATDPFTLRVQFPDGSAAPVHDLYSFQVTAGVYWISVEPTDPDAPGDLDLYLFFSNVNPNVVPLAQVPRFSLAAGSHELIGVRFAGAGTFLIGVSAFAGDVKYKLRVLPEPPIN